MKIALTTIGSRGDLQPYIALGRALQDNGHAVKILTHPWARDIIHSYALEHIPVGRNMDIHAIAKEFVKNSKGTLSGLQFALSFIFSQLWECHADLLEALEDFDLIIGHGIVGSSEADMLRKPYVSVSIETMGLQKDYWLSKNLLKEFGIYTADMFKAMLFSGPYRKFRRKIGAPPINAKREYPYLALIPISPQILGTNPYWKPVTEITGFFLAGTPQQYRPPESLIKFIQSGEKPIFITFGSMFHTREVSLKLFELVKESLVPSKSRAVMLMADLTASEIDIPENLYLVDQVSYPWLLPQVSLVIHHFGFGTTAEVLAAGLPSIPVPHIFDQKIRARQMHKKGLTYKPLDIGKLNAAELAGAISIVKSDENFSERCRTLSISISRENGLSRAVELINNHFSYIPD